MATELITTLKAKAVLALPETRKQTIRDWLAGTVAAAAGEQCQVPWEDVFAMDFVPSIDDETEGDFVRVWWYLRNEEGKRYILFNNPFDPAEHGKEPAHDCAQFLIREEFPFPELLIDEIR